MTAPSPTPTPIAARRSRPAPSSAGPGAGGAAAVAGSGLRRAAGAGAAQLVAGPRGRRIGRPDRSWSGLRRVGAGHDRAWSESAARRAHRTRDPPGEPRWPDRRGSGRRRDAAAPPGTTVVHQTSSSSASLCLSSSSTWATYFAVVSSSSFSARRPSSSPISPSLTSLSMASLALRRTLRMEILASSALRLATLMYSLRRSSVSSGNDHPDDVAVVARVDAEVGVADRLLDVAQGALVERGDRRPCAARARRTTPAG